MKGKLIKNIDYYPNDIMIYYSLIINEECIGTTHDLFNNEMTYKLSIKNCQAIERGYDLDELANRYCTHEPKNLKELRDVNLLKLGFRDGFQKALEFMGDKKFSEEDVKKAIFLCCNDEDSSEETIFESLQQTEWDVTFNPDEKDSDGCLILKRVTN